MNEPDDGDASAVDGKGTDGTEADDDGVMSKAGDGTDGAMGTAAMDEDE